MTRTPSPETDVYRYKCDACDHDGWGIERVDFFCTGRMLGDDYEVLCAKCNRDYHQNLDKNGDKQ